MEKFLNILNNIIVAYLSFILFVVFIMIATVVFPFIVVAIIVDLFLSFIYD